MQVAIDSVFFFFCYPLKKNGSAFQVVLLYIRNKTSGFGSNKSPRLISQPFNSNELPRENSSQYSIKLSSLSEEKTSVRGLLIDPKPDSQELYGRE